MNVIICFTAGYNYYGTERMFSGVNGQELEADIFIGVVYYQRLRHMVSDKFQVHSKLNSTGFCQSLSLFLSLSLSNYVQYYYRIKMRLYTANIC